MRRRPLPRPRRRGVQRLQEIGRQALARLHVLVGDGPLIVAGAAVVDLDARGLALRDHADDAGAGPGSAAALASAVPPVVVVAVPPPVPLSRGRAATERGRAATEPGASRRPAASLRQACRRPAARSAPGVCRSSGARPESGLRRLIDKLEVLAGDRILVFLAQELLLDQHVDAGRVGVGDALAELHHRAGVLVGAEQVFLLALALRLLVPHRQRRAHQDGHDAHRRPAAPPSRSRRRGAGRQRAAALTT